MKVMEMTKTTPWTEAKALQVEQVKLELDSWDEDGKAIAKQIIDRFPTLFPYFFKH